MPRIDFNCDLGEGCGDDAAIMPWITSANIACGAHSGDDATIRDTLRLCRQHGVVAGAHPGYDDREHFGRRDIELAAHDIAALMHDQLERIAAIAREEGVALRHVKPHGALYNRSAHDPAVAAAIAAAVRDFDPGLVLVGLSGSASTAAGDAAGLRVAHEVFAERGYGSDARLLPRGTPGAVLATLDAALAQARMLALHAQVRTFQSGSDEGVLLPLRADTLCLHGDRDDAAVFSRALREGLASDGVDILPFTAETGMRD